MERFSIAQNGFYGILQRAANPLRPEIALIVLGGSEGNENIALQVGRMFAESGITALGMCYWNVEGLPHDFIRIPLEPFARAAEFLEAEGFSEIYIYGISEGAKTALLCASVMPCFKGVVAVSPMHCVWNGKTGNGGLFSKKFTDASEYTFGGRAFPFMKIKLRYGPGLCNLLLQQQINIRYLYEEPLKHFDERTAIQVEKINGDILFIYAEDDTMWPSREAVRYMTERLKKKGFSHRAAVAAYEKASHILVPLNPPQLKFFKVERQFPAECSRSRQDAFERTLHWLLFPALRTNILE